MGGAKVVEQGRMVKWVDKEVPQHSVGWVCQMGVVHPVGLNHEVWRTTDRGFETLCAGNRHNLSISMAKAQTHILGCE